MITNTESVTKYDLIALLNLTDEKISYVDRSYVYRAVNDAYVRTFGFPNEEIIGKKIWEILGEEIFEAIVKPKMLRAFEGEHIAYESWFDFPDAPRAYLFVRYTPIYNEAGEINGVAVTTTDITERKKLEEERAIFEKMMMDRERIAQLGDILAMIAHEWRTPLQTLNTYLMLLQDADDTQKQAILDRCEELNAYLSETIEHINDVYQNDHNGEKTKTSFLDYVNRAIGIFRYRMQKEAVSVVLNVDEQCQSDHGEIMVHLFVIFIENALDAFTQINQPNKTITINIRCSEKEAIIEILDNGEGIRANIAHALFNAGVSTKKPYGKGYGLYIARKIITDQFKGELLLVEKDDGGHFKIVLPL